jgi:hypothetical protein
LSATGNDLAPQLPIPNDPHPPIALNLVTNTPSNDQWFANQAAQRLHLDQLKRVELFNGRAAMLGLAIGIITEGLTGAGIAHQIGLGPLVDGYAACHTQFLPFCF